jgi:hypothetical protein
MIIRPTRVWGNPMERALQSWDLGLCGSVAGWCLLRKPVAQGVGAEEAHEANFAVETL